MDSLAVVFVRYHEQITEYLHIDYARWIQKGKQNELAVCMC
jgi:hypothetical protein